MEKIEIWTDGASRGNPGPGAFACIIYKEGDPVKSYGSYKKFTTNNEMELSALLMAMRYAEAFNINEVEVYSDSSYVVSGYNDWLDNWVIRGQLSQKANSKLWHQVYELKGEFNRLGIKFSVIKTKGHADDVNNIEVDAECNRLMDLKEVHNIDLFNKLDKFKTYSDNEVNIKEGLNQSGNIPTAYSFDKNKDGFIFRFKTDKEHEILVPSELLKSLLDEYNVK